MIPTFIQILLSIKHKFILLITSQVIRSSRILHAKKYAKLYTSIHDDCGIQTIRHGSWDWHNIYRYRFLLETRQISSNTFLDIGSNIGCYSCNLSCFFSSVVAFEPNPISYHILKSNLMLTEKRSITQNKCFNFALGSNVHPLTLEITFGDNPAVTSLIRPSGISGSVNTYNVQVINASNAIFENIVDINSVSAVNLDVEGYELNVLDGLNEFLSSVNNLPLLTIKMIDVTSNPEILRLLVIHGYTHFYSYKRNKMKGILGIRPSMFKVSLDELSVGRFSLVYCSSYPLSFE